VISDSFTPAAMHLNGGRLPIMTILRPAALAAIVLLACSAGIVQAATGPSPVGNWRTFDDQDGKESGAVEITEQGGLLYGKITRISDPAKANAVCTACPDDRKGQPVLGMQVIRGLKPDGDHWDGGEIIDPKTGKIYRAKMHLEDGGQKLVVRGFIGIALFGRSQTWLRN
jgi:uncharacterized protein (DUF2147 family)